jgi:hypothetical protein
MADSSTDGGTMSAFLFVFLIVGVTLYFTKDRCP